jgi:predicted N-acyltransferase
MKPDRISIRWVQSFADIPDSLWAKCFPPPLEGRWFYRALERAGLESQFEFVYGLIEIDGEGVGIAPVFRMDLQLDLVFPPLAARLIHLIGRFSPRLAYMRALFIGSPCADEGTVGLVSGDLLERVAPALQDALAALARQQRVSLVVWKDFPENAWMALDAMAMTKGVIKAVSFPGTCMTLTGHVFADYLAQLNKKRRWGLKKKLKRSHERGILDAAVLRRPDPAALSEMFAIFWRTHTKGKVKFDRLTPQFFEEIAKEEQAYFITLRDPAQGKLVAFTLCFLVGSRAIFKFIGLDYDYGGDWHPYFRLWEVAVNWAMRMGATEIQSGQTGYTPKFDVGLAPVPLANYCKHRNKFMNILLRWIARHISWSTLDADLRHYDKAHDVTGE